MRSQGTGYSNLMIEIMSVEHCTAESIEYKYSLLAKNITLLLHTMEHTLFIYNKKSNSIQPAYSQKIDVDDVEIMALELLELISVLRRNDLYNNYVFTNGEKKKLCIPIYADMHLQAVIVTSQFNSSLLKEMKAKGFKNCIQCLGYTIAGILHLKTMENNKMMDSRTNLYDESMLSYNLNKLFSNGSYMDYIFTLLKIDGLDECRKRFGYSYTNSILRDIADFLKMYVKAKEQVYKFSDGVFCLLLLGNHREVFKKLEIIMNMLISREYYTNENDNIEGSYKYRANVHISMVDLPKLKNDELTIDSLYNAGLYSLSQIQDLPNGIFIFNQSKIYPEVDIYTKKSEDFNIYDILEMP